VSGVVISSALRSVPLDALLDRAHALLMDQRVFCSPEVWDKTRVYSQETVYSRHQFMMRDRFNGGHTYMKRAERDGFVRINPELVSFPAFKVSVRCKSLRSEDPKQRGRKDPTAAKLVWKCILLVAKWWSVSGPRHTLQSELQTSSLCLAGHKFTVGGGPVFHVLVALAFASCCGEQKTDLVFESYATKKLYSQRIADATLPVTKETARDAAGRLLSALQASAPCQIMRLRGFFEHGAAELLVARSVQLTVGVGCTYKAVHPDTPETTLLPVVQCVPTPWASGEPYFRAVTPKRKLAKGGIIQQVSTATALDQFVPIHHQGSWASFPVYGGTFPLALQPVTAEAKGRKTPLNSKITGADHVLSAHIIRVQQYAPHTRHAEGQCGLQKPGASVLGSIPIQQDPDTFALSINLEACREQVQRFAATATRHANALLNSGGVARVEVAVRCKQGEAYSECLREAIHDTVWIAQNRTKSYDLRAWCALIPFYVGGLQSRVDHAIQAMAPVVAPGGPLNDVQRRAAVTEVIADVFGAIKTFYSGRGTFRCTQRALTRTAYVYNRPIHARLRFDLQQARREVLDRRTYDWLTTFCSHLDGVTGRLGICDIPEFVPTCDDFVTPTRVTGFACPRCFAMFAPRAADDYARHLCPAADPRYGQRHDAWISLDSKPFKKHHAKFKANFSADQHRFVDVVTAPGSHNLALIGAPGTGKTTAVHAAREACYMRYGMLSTIALGVTHVAASGVQGRTLHSFLGLGPVDLCTVDPQVVANEFCAKHEQAAIEMQNNLQYLFVDEAGLLPGKALDLLAVFLRRIRTNAINRGRLDAFGGVKVILVGDPLQNGPVDRRNGFFFQSDVFCQAGAFRVVALKEVFRTPHLKFVNAQTTGRLGGAYLEDEDMEFLATGLGERVPLDAIHYVDEVMAALYHTTVQDPKQLPAFQIKVANYWVRGSALIDRYKPLPSTCSQLAACPAPYVICFENAEIWTLNSAYVSSFPRDGALQSAAVDEWPDDAARYDTVHFELPKHITVAVGMRVRFLRNDVAPCLHRNTLCVVVGIDRPYTVHVQLADQAAGQDSVTLPVQRVVESVPLTGHSSEAGDSTSPLYVRRTQFPFESCTAGNHYTVQGQTLVRTPCIFNNGRASSTNFGGACTILSRHTDPSYIRPLFPLTRADFVANEVALRWDQYHTQQENGVTEVDYSYASNRLSSCKCRTNHLATSCILCMDAAGLDATVRHHLRDTRSRRADTAARLASSMVAVAPPPPSDGEGDSGGSGCSTSLHAPSDEQRAALRATLDACLPAATTAVAGSSAGRKRGRDKEPEPRPLRFVGYLNCTKTEILRSTSRELDNEERTWLANTYAAVQSTYAGNKDNYKQRYEDMKRALRHIDEQDTLESKYNKPRQLLFYLWNCEKPKVPLSIEKLSGRAASAVKWCREQPAPDWSFRFEEFFCDGHPPCIRVCRRTG
jgi:hypothetical protein